MTLHLAEKPAPTESPADAPAAFYVTGGTVPLNATSYVERQADRDLLANLLAGEYCFVLNARQMGKSSLSVRTIARLKEHGIRTVFLDLTKVGGQNATADQWYAGMVAETGRQLDLRKEFLAYWKQNPELLPVQRYFGAIHDIALAECSEHIVIFVDEVDAVRSLPFSADEFFAAVRASYNDRATDPIYKRIAFCLVGSATPADLIGDVRASPFNVARYIELKDFTLAEASVLAAGLGAQGRTLLERVYYWTSGHPYLTQSLCASAAERGLSTVAQIDQLVADVFFDVRARTRNINLVDVANRLLRPADPNATAEQVDEQRAALLSLYDRVRKGRPPIKDDETDSRIALLKLSGITRVEKGQLRVRCRIYERVFDHAWVEENLPGAELRRQKAAYRRGQVQALALTALLSVVYFVLLVVAYENGERATRNAGLAARREKQARDAESAAHSSERQALLARRTAETSEQRAKQSEKQAKQSAADFAREAIRADAEKQHAQASEALALRSEKAALAASGEAKRAREEAINLAEARARALSESHHAELLARLAGLSEREARQQGEQLLYDANLQLAADVWENARGSAAAVRELLDTSLPRPGQPDRREFTWNLQNTQLTRGEAETVLPSLEKELPPGTKIVASGLRLDPSQPGRADVFLLDSSSRLHRRSTDSGGDEVVDLKSLVPPADGVSASDSITSSTLASSGRALAIGTASGRVLVLEPRSGRLLWEQKRHRFPVTFLRFVMNDARLLSGDDGAPKGTFVPQTLYWNNAATGADETPDWAAHPGLLFGHDKFLAFSHDGTRAAYQVYKSVTFLFGKGEPTTPDSKTAYIGPSSSVGAVAFRPDDQVLAVGDDGGVVYLFDVTSRRRLREFTAHQTTLYSCSFSPDGTLLATSGRDGAIHLWDAKSNLFLHGWKGHRTPATVAFSPDGDQLWSVGTDGEVRCWRISDLDDAAGFTGRNPMQIAITASADSRYLVTLGRPVERLQEDMDNVAFLRDARTGKLLRRYAVPGSASAVAISADSARIAIGTESSRIHLVDRESGQIVRTLAGRDYDDPQREVGALAFSPDGRRIAAGFGLWGSGNIDQIVKIWDVKTGALLHTLSGFHNATASLSFSPNGKWLAVGSHDSTIGLFNADSGQMVRRWKIDDSLNAVRFSPDGRTLAAGGDAAVYLLDPQRDAPPYRTLHGHSNAVRDIAFTPDSRTLASSSTDQTVKLWDPGTGRLLRTLTGFSNAVNDIAFSPGGERLYAVQMNGPVRLWEADDPGSAVREGRRQALLENDRVLKLYRDYNNGMLSREWGKAVRAATALMESGESWFENDATALRTLALSKFEMGDAPVRRGPNLLTDPKQWQEYHYPQADASFSAAADGSMRIDVRKFVDFEWSSQVHYDRLDMTPGMIYEVSFRIRSDHKRTQPFYIHIQHDQGRHERMRLHSGIGDIDTDWKLVRVSFIAPSDVFPGHTSLVFFPEREAGTLWLKDISFHAVTEQ